MKSLMKNTLEASIHISDTAIKKIKKLIKEKNNINLKLRIYITGGGCSGFKYGFIFELLAYVAAMVHGLLAFDY